MACGLVMTSIWLFVLLMAMGCQAQSIPGYKPLAYIRKTSPLDGQMNDIYQGMESQVASLQPGQTILYASVPLYAPLSKDPEFPGESYVVMAERDAVTKDARERRLLEDVLLEMGFPLDQLTQVDNNGRVVRLFGNPESGAKDPWSAGDTGPVTDPSFTDWVTEITYEGEAVVQSDVSQEQSSVHLLQSGGSNRATLAKLAPRLSPYAYARTFPDKDTKSNTPIQPQRQ